ncbi:MBL fold metallo-hydrolase [Qipengyuania gaetbuli]|uniref:MBL fold metallo-hydrolase n=1 Tax=Qipengyuania gaetbuli TaxID=266952 RepID=UPI001CD389AA|nr:MBL fold metallo-hydrolase [Qipengyuania gaetbuli]MCA0909652.1 MBL fold metallo-hydrolase [Qipengyuania gaetbuli]
MRAILALIAALGLAVPAAGEEGGICERELVVLGAGQDAGAPQIGNADDAGERLLPSSLALIDRGSNKRYLFDASPTITEQLALLDGIEPPAEGLGVDGIFLTHAHIGHYLGLAWLGREAAGAKDVPVYALPRMAEFLRANGPWSQLVELGNIEVRLLANGGITPLDLGRLRVLPYAVPHRDEYSETAGFMVFAGKTAFHYVPDIDSWTQFTRGDRSALFELVETGRYVFIDATFWDDNELPGRDMSEIPHPRVKATMDMLQHLPADQRAKVRFIHYNHTNPIRDPASAEAREVEARGFGIARRGDRFCLD